MNTEALEATTSGDDDGTAIVPAEPGLVPDTDRIRPSALRVIRGVGGIAGIWAVGWAGLGLALGLTLSVVAGFPMGLVLPSLISWAVSGFLTGAGFATLLATMERKNLLEELSVPRMAAWGALGGFTVSLLVFLVAGILPFIGIPWALFEGAKAGVLGGISAIGTTMLAKSADD